MIEFMRAGGVGMLFVLLTGLGVLATAAYFAVQPKDHLLSMVRGLSVAVVFFTLASVAANLATVFYTVPNNEELAKSADLPLIIMIGIGESLTPAVLGFGLLALSWVAAAVGLRRQGPRFA